MSSEFKAGVDFPYRTGPTTWTMLLNAYDADDAEQITIAWDALLQDMMTYTVYSKIISTANRRC